MIDLIGDTLVAENRRESMIAFDVGMMGLLWVEFNFCVRTLLCGRFSTGFSGGFTFNKGNEVLDLVEDTFFVWGFLVYSAVIEFGSKLQNQSVVIELLLRRWGFMLLFLWLVALEHILLHLSLGIVTFARGLNNFLGVIHAAYMVVFRLFAYYALWRWLAAQFMITFVWLLLFGVFWGAIRLLPETHVIVEVACILVWGKRVGFFGKCILIDVIIVCTVFTWLVLRVLLVDLLQDVIVLWEVPELSEPVTVFADAVILKLFFDPIFKFGLGKGRLLQFLGISFAFDEFFLQLSKSVHSERFIFYLNKMNCLYYLCLTYFSYF